MRQSRAIFLSAIFSCIANNAVLAATPAQQSKCEIASNRYWATHDPDKVFNPGNGNFIIFKFTPIDPRDAPPPDPVKAFVDVETKIVFLVEKDGRHVTATDSAGKLLWRRNPFVDFGMCPYRSAHPYIQWIGPPDGGNGPGWHLDSPSTAKPDSMTNAQIFKMLSGPSEKYPVPKPHKDDRFVGLAFNSSQFGYLNIRNGDFYFTGQN